MNDKALDVKTLKPLSQYADKWYYDRERDLYRLEGVIYVGHPAHTVTPGTEKTNGIIQTLNIYVPGKYMFSNGRFNEKGTVVSLTGKAYNVRTAPIIYENYNGGYCESPAVPLGEYSYYNEWNFGSHEEWFKNGYIVVLPGSRGSQTYDDVRGKYVGHAPASIVDLKAGLRYLRSNASDMPGDINKIISIGGSGAGAMSALLGSSGNSPEYEPYLREIGAIMEEKDHVFASMCYCPIIDITNANIAYEWMYGNQHIFLRDDNTGGSLTPFQIELSKDLAKLYPEYQNSLQLRDGAGRLLMLTGSRTGTYYDFLLTMISDSVTHYIKTTPRFWNDGDLSMETIEAYIASLDPSGCGWLYWDKGKKRMVVCDLDGFVSNYCHRCKPCPGFDNLERMEQENDAFGDEKSDRLHFDRVVYNLLKKNREKYLGLWTEADANGRTLEQIIADFEEDICDDTAIKLHYYHPMEHIAECTNARYFRIRVGALDGHTSFSVSVNFALRLRELTDSAVDFGFVWDRAHASPDAEGELCRWIDTICS